MLYTDSDIIAATDLLAVDSEVNAVAASCKPPLLVEGSGSICEQTWSECQQKILAAMQSYSGTVGQPGMANHNMAVLSTGLPSRTQARVRLDQIVVTDNLYGSSQSPLQTWMVYSALAMFYRDASSRLGKDRYEEKYERYLKDADKRWRSLRSIGLPMLYQPMECPGAKHAIASGSWTSANLSQVAGSGVTAQTVQVAITYYDASLYTSQSAIGNGESGPSEILTEKLTASHVLKVDITSLKPPAGVMAAVGYSQGISTPLNATHWNVWVGGASGALYLQNSVGIPIATKTYTLAADPVLSGFTLGRGQYPTLNLVFLNVVNLA